MTNAQLKLVTPSHISDINPLSAYKAVCEEIKRLETAKDAYKAQILALLDNSATDSLSVGDFKAERKLVVQSRFDTTKAKKVLDAETLASLQSETSFVKLTVI